MKKVTYIVSLLMVVGLVLTAMVLVPASAAQAQAAEEEAAVLTNFTIDLEPGHREAWPYPGDPPEEPYLVYTHVGVGKIEQVPYPQYVELSTYHSLKPFLVVTFEDDVIQPGYFTRMRVRVLEHAPYGDHVITVVGTAYDPATGVVTVTREVGFLLTIREVPLPPFNFALRLHPTELVVEQCTSETFLVVVTWLEGLPEEVVLSYKDLPVTAGVTITFYPERGTPMPGVSFVSTVTVTAKKTAAVRPREDTRVDLYKPPHVITIIGTAVVPPNHPQYRYYRETDTLTLSVVPPEHQILLQRSWNLISLPVIPLVSNCIDNVLAGIGPYPDPAHPDFCPEPRVIRVWQYGAGDIPSGDVQWRVRCFVVGIYDLQHITYGYGYWVKMSAPAILTVRGLVMPLPPERPPVHKLHEGWNLIGFRSTEPMTVAEYLGSLIIETVGAMWRFCAERRIHISLTPACVIHPGWGFWIYIDEAATLS